MKSFLPVLTRTLGAFVAFFGLQFLIPWYLLAFPGVIAGYFMLKTSNDRPTALGILIGSILFGIFAYVNAQFFPVK